MEDITTTGEQSLDPKVDDLIEVKHGNLFLRNVKGLFVAGVNYIERIAANTKDIATNATNITANTASIATTNGKFDKPFFKGTPQGQWSSYTQIVKDSADRFYMSNANDIVCQESGWYFISIQQLQKAKVGTNDYWELRVNASLKKYAFIENNSAYADRTIQYIIYLYAGHYVNFRHTASVAGAWSGLHSDVSIIKISS